MIETGIDAIALAVQLLRETVPAMLGRDVGAAIETIVDAVTFIV